MTKTIQKRDAQGRIMKGNKLTSEVRIKMGKRNRGTGNPFYGKHHTKETIKKMIANNPLVGKKGSESMAWKGGSWQWAVREVKARDNYTCQDCGLDEGKILVVDHIKPKSVFPELILVLDNLVTLCPNCHARKTLRDIAQYKINVINRRKL